MWLLLLVFGVLVVSTLLVVGLKNLFKKTQRALGVKQSRHYCLSNLCDTSNSSSLAEGLSNTCCCSNTIYPSANSGERLEPDLKIIPTEASITARYSSNNLQHGGFWSPAGCSDSQKMALIVPFRRRETHLLIFLNYIHDYLQQQNLTYAIYVVDQVDTLEFNRAMLLNVGFLEAMKERQYECFLFHDVDHIPVDPMLSYWCDKEPMHMSSRTDVWEWKLPYKSFVGGVTKQLTSQVYRMNGFANVFWGWGGEDDDIFIRWREAGFHFERPPDEQGQYATIKRGHYRDRTKSRATRFDPLRILKTSRDRIRVDGLNTVKYDIVDKKKTPLYTRLRVKLQVDEKFLYLYKKRTWFGSWLQ